tara:strand:+ start:6661 stop:7248 length:588 start_codon:yes stop_codon:yes gene_type:complete
MLHELKISPEYFKDILSGVKTFEVRLNDRNYLVGDILVLNEFVSEVNEKHPDLFFTFYSGKNIGVKITYILDGGQFGIMKNYVVMAFEKLKLLHQFSAFHNGKLIAYFFRSACDEHISMMYLALEATTEWDENVNSTHEIECFDDDFESALFYFENRQDLKEIDFLKSCLAVSRRSTTNEIDIKITKRYTNGNDY